MGGSLCAKCIQIGTLPASSRSRKFYPIVAGDYAYLGHDEALIRTVNNQDHLVWTYQLGTPIKTEPVVCGNLLFAHDYSGNLWRFAPTV